MSIQVRKKAMSNHCREHGHIGRPELRLGLEVARSNLGTVTRFCEFKCAESKEALYQINSYLSSLGWPPPRPRHFRPFQGPRSPDPKARAAVPRGVLVAYCSEGPRERKPLNLAIMHMGRVAVCMAILYLYFEINGRRRLGGGAMPEMVCREEPKAV